MNKMIFSILSVSMIIVNIPVIQADEDIPWKNISPSIPFAKMWDTSTEDRDGVHVITQGWVTEPYRKSLREISPLYEATLGEEAIDKIKSKVLRHEVEQLLFLETEDHRLYAVEAASGVIKWITSFTMPIQYKPWFGDNNIYLTSNEVLYATNRQYGLLAWRKPLRFPVSSSPIAGDMGRLYMSSWENRIFCYNTDERYVRWQYRVGGNIVATPGYSDGLLYIPCEDGGLYCLKETGELNFKFQSKGALRTSPCLEKGLGFVIIASNDNSVYCLNKYNGSKVWECRIGRPLREKPEIIRTTVFIKPYRKGITAISLETGKVLWQIPYTTDIVGYGEKTVYLYTGNYRRQLILGVSQDTGTIEWVWNPRRTFRIDFNYPLKNVELINKVFLANKIPGQIIGFREKGMFEKKEWEEDIAVAEDKKEEEKKKEEGKEEKKKEDEKKKDDILEGLEFLEELE